MGWLTDRGAIWAGKLQKQFKHTMIFLMPFQRGKLVSIITFWNRHRFFPALKWSCGEGHRWVVQIVGFIRADPKRSEGLQPAGTVTQALRGGATLYSGYLVRGLVGVLYGARGAPFWGREKRVFFKVSGFALLCKCKSTSRCFQNYFDSLKIRWYSWEPIKRSLLMFS